MGILSAGVIVILVLVIIILVIVAVIAAAIIGVVKKTTRSVKNVTDSVNTVVHTAQTISKVTTGTSDIAEGIRRTTFEYAATPKTVSDNASIYLPKIAKDFPEFNNTEMVTRAGNVLTSYLFAIDNSDASKLKEGNEELKNKLQMQIDLNKDKGYVEHYERIKLHKCGLSNYVNDGAKCVITYQAAVQYLHYITEGDKIKTGRNDLMTQAKYNIDLIYIQDRDKVDKYSDMVLSSVCPHCGAPVKGTGEKVCPYCGSPVEIINIYAWSFADIKETK